MKFFKKKEKPHPPSKADKMRNDLDERLDAANSKLDDVLSRLKDAGDKVISNPRIRIVRGGS